MLNINHYREAANNHTLMEAEINGVEDERLNSYMLNPKNWEVNNFKDFIASRDKSNKHSGFVTPYTEKEYRENNAKVYKLKGYDIGFALQPNQGDTDIISVFNNDPRIGKCAPQMLQVARKLGGTTLDHFDTHLSDIYSQEGFVEYQRDKWNDMYAPKGWNYEKYGKPDVIYRRYNKTIKEMLSLIGRML